MNDLHTTPVESAAEEVAVEEDVSAGAVSEEAVPEEGISEEDISAKDTAEDSSPAAEACEELIPAQPASSESFSLQVSPPAGPLAVPMKKEPYIGSVRFFKNLILLVMLTAIAIPSVISVIQYRQLCQAEETTQQLHQQISDLETSLQESIAAQTAPSTEASPDPSEDVPPSESSAPFPGDIPAYQELFPDFYAETPFTGDERIEGMIYLTFDDGPSARTPEILQILREEDVKATFFVIGNDTEQGRQWMRDIVADGHTIAMHTYSHNYSKIYASVEDYLADMYQIFTLVKEATGVTPTLFRFPGGSINGYNYGIYQELTSEMLRRGFMPCDWNISSQDAAGGTSTAVELTNNVVIQSSGVSRGVVLMHDAESKRATVAALSSMIQQLREKGFSFDRLTPETKPVLYGYRD